MANPLSNKYNKRIPLELNLGGGSILRARASTAFARLALLRIHRQGSDSSPGLDDSNSQVDNKKQFP